MKIVFCCKKILQMYAEKNAWNLAPNLIELRFVGAKWSTAAQPTEEICESHFWPFDVITPVFNYFREMTRR